MAHTEGGEVVKTNDCKVSEADMQLMIDLEFCRTLPSIREKQDCMIDARSTYEAAKDAQSFFIAGVVIVSILVFLATVYIVTKNFNK